MKLLIVDDDILIVKSLSLLISREDDIEIVGCASNGSDAVKICEEQMPDIVLMDIRMPVVDGIAATHLIKKRFPNVRVMILTTFDDKPNVQQALSVGADGYLIKTDKVSDIAGKLRAMMDGVGVLSVSALKKLTLMENSELEQLTQRERDITRLVSQGLTNKEIAARLFLGEGTVRNNIVIIMEKLCVTNRTQLGLKFFEKTD